ncbi:hypothetical protein ABZT43_12050 [Streptomyces sp. NPDC005349]|uniref:hypothetical protein n=1 Tax=Streptomyces sp. NPDC005349 TaxID=3157037 RepID=UPI0033ADAD30
MEQPTDPPAASEEPRETLVCPCGSLDHEPVWRGGTLSVSGPERDLYDCPQVVTHWYGLGPVS